MATFTASSAIKPEGSDFRAESHLTAWYFDEGLSNG